jgi:hypothetical protein
MFGNIDGWYRGEGPRYTIGQPVNSPPTGE